MVNEMVLEIPWPQVPIQAWGINWVLTVFQGALLVAQLEKNPPAVRETWVQSLGWEDALEKGKATLCSILAWRIP